MGAAAAEFLGLTANGWTAVGTMALAVVTALLVLVGRNQLVLLREENKRSRTLAVCERYDTDPVLDNALRNLWKGWRSRDIHHNPRRYNIDLATLLNFLESICTGIEAGIYDGEIVKRYFQETFRIHIEDYVTSGLAGRMGLERSAYVKIVDSSALWDSEGSDDVGTEEINHLTQTRFTFRLGGFWFFLRQS
jgi:hypothetical protein